MGCCPFSGLCRDRESLSRQGFLSLVSRQAIPCHDRAHRLGTRPGRCAHDMPAWAWLGRARATEQRARNRAARIRQRHMTLCRDKIFMSRQGLGGDRATSVATEVSLSRQSPFWPCVATRLAWFDVMIEFLYRDRVCVFGVAA